MVVTSVDVDAALGTVGHANENEKENDDDDDDVSVMSITSDVELIFLIYMERLE